MDELNIIKQIGIELPGPDAEVINQSQVTLRTHISSARVAPSVPPRRSRRVGILAAAIAASLAAGGLAIATQQDEPVGVGAPVSAQIGVIVRKLDEFKTSLSALETSTVPEEIATSQAIARRIDALEERLDQLCDQLPEGTPTPPSCSSASP